MTDVLLRDGSTTSDPRIDLLKHPDSVDLDRHHILEVAGPPAEGSAPGLEHAGLTFREPRTWRDWTPGPVLDQQREGACVLHAQIGDAMASPRRLYRDNPEQAQLDAFEFYWRAQDRDPFPETHKGGQGGTTLEAGAEVCIEEGHFTEYRWAENVDQAIAAMLRGRDDDPDAMFGPCIVAVEWRDGMYETPAIDPLVSITGSVVGWHALLVRAVAMKFRSFSSPAFIWRNSWGPDYGANGDAYILADDLERILGPYPEIMFPVGRAKSRTRPTP